MLFTRSLAIPLRQSIQTRAAVRTLKAAPRCFATSAVRNARISESVMRDHRELEESRDKLLAAHEKDDVDAERRWQNHFTWLLARHSVGEELVLYPAFEDWVHDGKEMAEVDRAEHREIKDALAKFQRLHPRDDDFIPTFTTIWKVLSKHVEEEENIDLPKLEKEVTPTESESLNDAFERWKKFAPTRSHPNMPDRPPFETAMGLLTTPIDRVRDLFAKFPYEKS